MRIQVTQEDIDKGVPIQPCECPVALAINRHLPDVRASVSYRWIESYKFGVFISHVKTPLEVREFLAKVDCNESPEPFEFELPVTTFAEASR